ncbi:MAG TPA: erythromycin esterase family protein [Bryobacteraceae bacterium]|nr:erythromycin esterase family protein [Bryobacteraceae bacterium]
MTRRAVLGLGAGAIGAAILQPAKAAASEDSLREAVRNSAMALTGEATDLHAISAMTQNASYVLIGEASHGTHEFYSTRAAITRMLIEEKGFNAVLVEADWPDAYRVNNFVRVRGEDATVEQALSSFDKFPQWMWGNTDVRDFTGWLREHNAAAVTHTGFYGMDVYSLFRSRDAVLRYLDEIDPEEARRARERYAPLEQLGDDPQWYGYMVALGRLGPMTDAVREQFEEMKRIASLYRTSADRSVADAAFNAEQNARVVMNAEEYFRQMYQYVNTWNLRDRHMADTLDALAEYLRERDGYARIAVWAHNSHIGDARATDSVYRGEWNIGQLVRERHPNESFHIGFSTYTGTVMATTNWGQPGVVKQVRPALPGSYEKVFHETGIPAFLLPLQNEPFKGFNMLERAIGVQYLPETERQSHYFGARIADQFDAIIHLDVTSAVEPLTPETASERRAA